MNLITSNIVRTKEYKNFLESFDSGLKSLYVTGLDLNGGALFSGSFFSEREDSDFLIAPSDLDAKKIYDDMSSIWDNVYYLPEREVVYFDSFAHSNDISNQRMEILGKIIKNENIVVIGSIEAFLSRQIPVSEFKKMAIELKVGELCNLENLSIKLLSFGYERVEKIEFKGSFCIKGGILDVFDPQYEEPIRVEFFDDEIDSIRNFNLFSQISIDKINEISISPSKEIILSESMKDSFMKSLLDELNDKKTSEELREKILLLADNIKKIGYEDKLSLYVDYFPIRSISILDYFSENSRGILINPEKIGESADFINKNNLIRFENYFSKGMLLKNQYNLFLNWNEILESLYKKSIVLIDNLQKNLKSFFPEQIVSFKTLEAPTYSGNIQGFIDDAKRWSYKGYKIAVFIEDEIKLDSIKDEVLRADIPVIIRDDMDGEIKSSQCAFIRQSVRKGIVFDSIKFVIVSENELFKNGKGRKFKKDKNKKMIKSFSELKKGDLVVHEAHGIGKYIGIEQLKVESIVKDYFKIMYSGDDFLYIPIDQMNLIQKYIGGEEKKVKLHKMGGTEWKKAKSNAKKAIEDMTEELLALYAERKSKIGYSFSEDSQWQRELEDMFPYEETPDQLKCIDEIKKDMEKDIPMDRLLCGDVGFGKTEVAIRAAFKAINDSKQVAFLVPTTILAQQHYSTIQERFSKFPVKVQVLSRFKTKKEQEVIIENLRTGNVDIIVGTHRLLSKDVNFKDLGLLIIDEEQRFGVKHKEKIKQIKTNVDVLTLTATPIPRTLHMSLIGIRDMSVIEDPPEDRYPIQTYVVEENEFLLKEAIEKEISRGGQVYYVYNNVKTIDYVTEKIQRLVPDANIRYAHGQMNEGKLEKIMHEFLLHEFDVLVCTTIIETGLDISNVNTIIIDNADRMGISQLYQLRGRVGRSNRIAYAYLFYRKNKILSEIAEKRLKGIKEFTELGSGFKIAMRDLEIRGSGNILGSNQHGQIDSIGYEYYCKLLEETVNKVKGNVIDEPIETEIEILINAFIPENFVKNSEDKIEIYKKIASIRNKEDSYEIEEEIEDRYGTLPTSVYNLIGISYLKALAQKVGISAIKEKGKNIVVEFRDQKWLTKELIEKIMVHGKNRVEFDLSEGMIIEYKFNPKMVSKEDKLKEIKLFLEKITV